MEKRVNYWHQKASPWVSVAVLAGGMVTALLLFWLVRVEAKMQNFTLPVAEEYSIYFD